jgi:hypothetical protein
LLEVIRANGLLFHRFNAASNGSGSGLFQFFNKTDFPTIAHKWKEKTDSAANIQEDDLPF